MITGKKRNVEGAIESEKVVVQKNIPGDIRYDFMLSYVIKESAQFTKRLSESLKRRKYGVFLGEDILQIGMNWPLTLTKAIETCGIFVPIITPSLFSLLNGLEENCTLQILLTRIE